MSYPDHPVSMSLARIRGIEGTVVGAGFVVAPDLVCTCAHVVANALGMRQTPEKAPDATVHLDFPFHGEMDLSANIVFWKPIVPNESGDIAVLRLTSSLPADLKIAPLLLEIPLPKRHFEVYGFPKGNDTGAWARGELSYRRPDGSIQIEDTKNTGYRIQPGFSGAPVWDVQGHGVVGMVVEAELDPMAKAAYIIPSALLIKAWPLLSQQSTVKGEREQVIVQLPSIRTRSESVYSWPLQPNFAHPYPLQEHFTGRIRERKMLTEWLTSRKHSLLALVAIGGMGKSSLTWYWLQHDVLDLPLMDPPHASTEAEEYHLSDSDRPEGVLWWSFYEREAHFAAFLEEALAYASDGSMNPATISSPLDKVRILVTLLQQHRILLVLDGFERELRAYASLSAAYQGDFVVEDAQGDFRACTNPYASDFLRRVAALSLKGRILLTSRLFPRELDNLVGCRREDLTSLDPEDAVIFFRAQGIKGTKAAIQDICELYGFHPLALRLLTGLVRDDPAKPGDIMVAIEYNPISHLVSREHHILDLAYDSLRQPLRELLSRLATFRSQMDFETVKVVSPFQTDGELKDALKDLGARGLLFFDRKRARYDLHPIVRQYAYDRLIDRAAIHTRLRDYFASVPEAEIVKNIEDLAPVIELYHHTIYAGQYDAAWMVYNERIKDLLYYRLGKYETDLQLLAALPQTPDGLPNLSLPSAQVWSLLYTAMCYSRTGNAKLALKCAEKAFQLACKVEDRNSLASALTVYSISLCDIGRLQQASTAVCESIDLSKRIRNLYWQGISHHTYGQILMYCGNLSRAEQEFNAAKQSFDESSSEFAHDHCGVLLSLAQLYLLQGEPSKALEFAKRAKDRSQAKSFKLEEIKAMWLVGAIQVALDSKESKQQDESIAEDPVDLTKALINCRSINLREVEINILVAMAYWHYFKGDSQQAWQYANEALTIADQSEYRLKQADIHNVMALMALSVQDYDVAVTHAQSSYNYALCDGPPYCYKPALEIADQLLNQIKTIN